MPYDGRPWPVRFWEKVPVPVGDGCMEWQGHRNHAGYGRICRVGVQYMAHRISYEMHNGPIPNGLQVCHKCDNPPCVRPDHLFLGTAKDNARDRQNKGRFTPPRFDRDSHPRAKLTTRQVAEVRSRVTTGRGGNVLALAAEYGVSREIISQIARTK